jgi:hypothetical protein
MIYIGIPSVHYQGPSINMKKENAHPPRLKASLVPNLLVFYIPLHISPPGSIDGLVWRRVVFYPILDSRFQKRFYGRPWV